MKIKCADRVSIRLFYDTNFKIAIFGTVTDRVFWAWKSKAQKHKNDARLRSRFFCWKHARSGVLDCFHDSRMRNKNVKIEPNSELTCFAAGKFHFWPSLIIRILQILFDFSAMVLCAKISTNCDWYYCYYEYTARQAYHSKYDFNSSTR